MSASRGTRPSTPFEGLVFGLLLPENYKKWKAALPLLHPVPSLFFFFPNPNALISPDKTTINIHQDVVNTLPQSSRVCAPTVKIQSLLPPAVCKLPTHHSSESSVLPVKEDLNFTTASHSFGSSSNTVTIPAQDYPVFTTDSQQSPWLPSSSPSLPAASAQQPQQQAFPSQDFVLFDTPKRSHQPSRSVSHSVATRSASHNHRHHPHAASPSVQNQRVAQIIQATGHSTSPTAYTNRFTHSAQTPGQFYSSAPSSTVALNTDQLRAVRPPVPLFSQSTGNINTHTQGKMNAQDLSFEDFTAFEGGVSAFSSPAMHGVFDINSSSSVSNMGTVSPQDLLLQEPFMSAPNSSALTALTSPSLYHGSPEFGDGSYDVSPNISGNDIDSATDVWYPLFPQTGDNINSNTTVTQLARNPAPQPQRTQLSPTSGSDDVEPVERSPAPRRKSGNSPTSGRHSSVAGVNSRRRDKPLPPIVVEDPSDIVAMKRARNTLAARKSRERKAMRFEELEEKIAKLEAERDHWKTVAQSLGAAP
ncbi:hypothetical protein RB597_003516 [Gaeumannomyces tritici]